MNRRSFLQALGLSAAAVALSPMLDLAPIAPAMSATVIQQRKIMARIRITQEVMDDYQPGAFVAAMRDDCNRMVRDLALREDSEYRCS